ncbi:MAG: hypothetical protein ACLSGS_10760 [Adlercreutzia sp.]
MHHRQTAIDGDSCARCPHCGLKFDGPSLAAGHVCPCGGYLRMSSSERIDDLLDADSFVEWNRTVPETDPLEFPGYLGKLEAQREKTGLEEGVRTGVGRIAGLRVAIGIMESQFSWARWARSWARRWRGSWSARPTSVCPWWCSPRRAARAGGSRVAHADGEGVVRWSAMPRRSFPTSRCSPIPRRRRDRVVRHAGR